MRRATPLLLLLPLLAACGGTPPTPDVATAVRGTADDPAALLAGVPAATDAAGSVRYESITAGALEDEPPRVEGRLAGVLDLAADAGSGDLELPGFADLAADAAAAGDGSAGDDLAAMARFSLTWTATDVTVDVDGERHTAPRGSEDGGLVGRVPAEPAGLLEAVAAATDAAVVGQQDVDGVPTTRVTATLEPQAAVDAGLGTQASLSIAALPSLPVEVWLDADGRPARIRYAADVPSLQGRTRTMTTTYDYRGWGEPVDVTR